MFKWNKEKYADKQYVFDQIQNALEQIGYFKSKYGFMGLHVFTNATLNKMNSKIDLIASHLGLEWKEESTEPAKYIKKEKKNGKSNNNKN